MLISVIKQHTCETISKNLRNTTLIVYKHNARLPKNEYPKGQDQEARRRQLG